MTVVEDIIEKAKEWQRNSYTGFVDIAIIVAYATSRLPAEEQQIRDAHVSGRLYEQGKHQSYDNPQPDLETYITHLKTKA